MDTSIPPWLNVSPRDFLSALQAGHSLGLGIATEQARLNESAANRVNDFLTQQRAFAQRQAEQERQQALAVWETQQRMAMEAQRVAAQQAQAQAQQEALNEYRLSDLDIRRGETSRKAAEDEAMMGYRYDALAQRDALERAKREAAYQDELVKGGIGPDEAAWIENQGEDPLSYAVQGRMPIPFNPAPGQAYITKGGAVVKPQTENTLPLDRFKLSLQEAMVPKLTESPTDQSFLSRSNMAAGMLQKYTPPSKPEDIDWFMRQITGANSPQVLPNPAAGTILSLPKSKQDLETGQVYQTSRGPARWDGEKFIKE